MEAEMFQQAGEPLRANTATCIPRLRGGIRRPRRRGVVPAAPTSVSVMDRLRDVLLRLAMLSAASSSPTKAGAGRLQQQQQATAAAAAPSRAASVRMSPSPTTYPDSYRSEAVDECIEFLKRSAAGRGAASSAAAVELLSSAPAPLHASACAMGI